MKIKALIIIVILIILSVIGFFVSQTNAKAVSALPESFTEECLDCPRSIDCPNYGDCQGGNNEEEKKCGNHEESESCEEKVVEFCEDGAVCLIE